MATSPPLRHNCLYLITDIYIYTSVTQPSKKLTWKQCYSFLFGRKYWGGDCRHAWSWVVQVRLPRNYPREFLLDSGWQLVWHQSPGNGHSTQAGRRRAHSHMYASERFEGCSWECPLLAASAGVAVWGMSPAQCQRTGQGAGAHSKARGRANDARKLNKSRSSPVDNCIILKQSACLFPLNNVEKYSFSMIYKKMSV